ncbi:hypothetical protein EMEDMD4_470042 [Sinorhizobium medicae]|uniref:Uncharacterized protein n=1 Tax=Sinorhizobium medicae TaxID=110321 RepID=A0A508X4E2_9HYPH|nr:hypothetical protein EMEDMD4_470042 [Sinorhizobium medicae]
MVTRQAASLLRTRDPILDDADVGRTFVRAVPPRERRVVGPAVADKFQWQGAFVRVRVNRAERRLKLSFQSRLES